MTYKASYCHIAVICAGKSEQIVAQSIRRSLRLQMVIMPEPMQIGGLADYVNKLQSNQYFRGQAFERDKKAICKLKIFTVLDFDDEELTDARRSAYLDKSLLHKGLLKDFIVPIYNSPNLDEVFIKAGYPVDVNDKVNSYTKLFSGKDIDKAFKSLCDNIKEVEHRYPNITNLSVFLEECKRQAGIN